MFRLLYLFRNTKQFFSIENVFRQVSEEIGKDSRYQCIRSTLPQAGFSPVSLFKNARFGRRLSADIYHVTGDVHYMALFLPGGKTVLTIHDCNFVHQNKGIKRWVLKKLQLDWPVRRSRLVTTVSQQTKNDVIRLTGCREDKVIVIANPVNKLIVPRQRDFSKSDPVLLFIGITANKNLARVAEALKGIRCTLDIIGKLPPADEERLRAAGVNYRSSFDLTDLQIAERYSACDLVVFPSVFEGFGLPIIEGQRAGRAVLTSDLAPMNEVAGGAACLVDPYNIDSIRAGILKLIEDEAYRDDLIRKGFVNAEKFSPRRIADLYIDCYNKVKI